MKNLLLAALLVLCGALPAQAVTLEEFTPYLGGEYYNWQEFGASKRLLREEGALAKVGALACVVALPWTLRGRAELLGGEVDYHGETQAPQAQPVATEVDYFGTRTDLDLGYRFATGWGEAEPFLGLGFRYWLRVLDDTRTSDGRNASGYTEWWQTGYTRLGARGRWPLTPRSSLFLEGGAQYPFYAANSVDFSTTGWTTFRPRGLWSGFAETGLYWQKIRLAFFYEGFRFARSPEVTVGNMLYFQPDSSSEAFGLTVGWTFR
jgi:hypothetical protein